MIFSSRNKIKLYIQSRRVFPESLNAIGVKSTGFSIVFIGKTARNSFRVLVARKFARYISIHRNFIVHTYTHVTVRYKMFVCTRARSSRAFLFSPFLALVIGRFHRRVSVARSARCDVVQGQGHMVTGGRGGHTSYRYISTTGRDPPPPPSLSFSLPSPTSSSTSLRATAATTHRQYTYGHTYITTKYERRMYVRTYASFDPASRSPGSSGSRNTAAHNGGDPLTLFNTKRR